MVGRTTSIRCPWVLAVVDHIWPARMHSQRRTHGTIPIDAPYIPSAGKQTGGIDHAVHSTLPAVQRLVVDPHHLAGPKSTINMSDRFHQQRQGQGRTRRDSEMTEMGSWTGASVNASMREENLFPSDGWRRNA